MARSLNRAQIIGNLTKDPELRYTPNGTAVCSFSIATNRNWTTDSGEKKEDVEFHRVVAWNKLAEICSQFLVKGRKVFVEGRLSTRSWNAQDGTSRSTTEIIISDMILLDSKRSEEEKVDSSEAPVEEAPAKEKDKASKTKPVKEKAQEEPQGTEEEISPDDIPF
ncbi:MAG: single-stranded DNA-binding protein [Patescibacteria group bacterium]